MNRAAVWLGISVGWMPLAFLFDGVTLLMLPLRVGTDATSIGLVSFVGLALAAGLQPVAGWLSDRLRVRVDRRLFLAAAAVPTIAGLWIFTGTTGLVGGVIGYILLQAGATSVQAAQQTFIPEHIGDQARGRASGLKVSFDVGGSFLAFLLLGALLASGGLVPATVVITVLVLAAVWLVIVLVPPISHVGATTAPRWSLRVPPGVGSLIAARLLFLFATYSVGRFLVLLAGERLGIPPERAVDEAAGLLALFTLATAVVAIPLGAWADRRPRNDFMVAGALVAALGILVLVPDAGLGGIVAGGLLMSLGTAAFMSSNWAQTAALAPRAEAGRLMAIANLGTGLAAAGAGALGPLIDLGGFVPALLIAATAAAAALIPLGYPSARTASAEVR